MEVLSADMDRLSTASGMSESSVSHRLNDVQDVQDVARMQEESLRHPPVSYQPRSATISPSSDGSLCSPPGPEDGGGYQSEGSCGSEGGGAVGGARPQEPKRGEGRLPQYGQRKYSQLQPRKHSAQQYTSSHQQQPYGNSQQYSNQQYSSQDSLPDSPYSSQSLDSHHSQQGPDTRRSMPNLNKLRGGRGGTTMPRPQYGLSQTRHTNSEGRLQPPARIPGSGGLRAPTAAAVARPSATNPPACALFSTFLRLLFV